LIRRYLKIHQSSSRDIFTTNSPSSYLSNDIKIAQIGHCVLDQQRYHCTPPHPSLILCSRKFPSYLRYFSTVLRRQTCVLDLLFELFLAVAFIFRYHPAFIVRVVIFCHFSFLGIIFMILSYYLDLLAFPLCQMLFPCLYSIHCHHHCLSGHYFTIKVRFLSSFSLFHCHLPCYHHPQPYFDSETTHEEPGGWSAVTCYWAIKQGSSSPLEHAARHIG